VADMDMLAALKYSSTPAAVSAMCSKLSS
jgi:hypothetical protein